MKLKDIQGEVKLMEAHVASTGNAASTGGQAVGRVPFRAVVTAVKFIADAAVTGATATEATLTLTNRTGAGLGSTAVAAKSFITGEDMVAFAPEDITVSGTAANLDVAEGDVLTIDKTVTSTGTLIPAGTVVVYGKAR
jgi:hypothetical protein